MRVVLSSIVILVAAALTAQTFFTRLGEEAAANLAAAKGTFVIIDFYATWCGPCKVMDEKTWSQDTVQSLQSRFVNRRIDATNTNTALAKYGIKAIPALIIEDANGKEYFRRVGYMTKDAIVSLLNQFPPGMEGLYAADFVAREEPGAFNSHFLRARHYQVAARSANGAIAARLANTSTDGLKDARKILGKNANNPNSLLERLDLMEAENLLLSGRAKKALKLVAGLEDKLDPRNEAHACYIKGMAYRKTGRPELAQDCYDQLQEAKDNEEFLAMYAKEESADEKQ
ncbi:MAG: thioredoxin-like negative regulator of GroEL [Neolewinella sp.]|jgi:thioredoxin-like negative regulator of GroEL